MAFHIKSHRQVDRELRRLARKEFQKAIEVLEHSAPDEDAIHEARKCFKKIRSILRLVRPNIADYRRQNQRLRSAAHALAALRDADAMAETVAMLHGRYPKIVNRHLEAALTEQLRDRSRRLRARAPRVVAAALRVLREMHDTTPAKIADAAAFGVARKAATKAYRRARNAMVDISLQADAAQFHLLRRRLKNHWYQMRLFNRLHSTPRYRARHLKRLDTWLGDDHNLAVLRSTLVDSRPRLQGAKANALVLGCIVKRQATLRRRALETGRRLFQPTPRQFKRSVTRWWRKGRR